MGWLSSLGAVRLFESDDHEVTELRLRHMNLGVRAVDAVGEDAQRLREGQERVYDRLRFLGRDL